MVELKNRAEKTLTAEEYRKGRKDAGGLYIELSIGTVEIQPELMSSYYKALQLGGVRLESKEDPDIEFDGDGNPKVPKGTFQLHWDRSEMHVLLTRSMQL